MENRRQDKEVVSSRECELRNEIQLLKTENRVLMERLTSYEADKNQQKRIDVLENNRKQKEILSFRECELQEEIQLLKTERRVLMGQLMSYEAEENQVRSSLPCV